jgi:hypothetical protein
MVWTGCYLFRIRPSSALMQAQQSSRSIKNEEFVGQMSDYQLFKKKSAH